LHRVHIVDPLLLLGDVRPDLIDLDAPAWKLAHPLIQEPLAALADAVRQTHYRIPVNPGHALDAPDAVSFDQRRDHSQLLAPLEDVHGGLPFHQRRPYTGGGILRAPAAQSLECGLPLRRRVSGVGGLLAAEPFTSPG